MQFETLRQFCSSVLSHFNGAFTPPQNVLQTELLEQTLSTIGWVCNTSQVTIYAFSEGNSSACEAGVDRKCVCEAAARWLGFCVNEMPQPLSWHSARILFSGGCVRKDQSEFSLLINAKRCPIAINYAIFTHISSLLFAFWIANNDKNVYI